MKLILIPGAWSDESIWKPLAAELSHLGIRYDALTLSGLGQKNGSISLSTHVDDVVSHLNQSEREKCVLVGHSYSGMVVSLAAERVPDKIAGLIFVEAFLPENGKSLLQVAGLDVAAETLAIEQNNGLWPPPTKEELMAQPFLSDTQKHYLINNMTGQPGKTVTDKAQIRKGAFENTPILYIGGSLSNSIKANPDFGKIDFKKLDGGHWPMLSKPKELAGIIQGFWI
jgi:pimeloyl-ACP methyl ester carboxylesterase